MVKTLHFQCSVQSVQFSRSVMSDSLQPHELQHVSGTWFPSLIRELGYHLQHSVPKKNKDFFIKIFLKIKNRIITLYHLLTCNS